MADEIRGAGSHHDIGDRRLFIPCVDRCGGLLFEKDDELPHNAYVTPFYSHIHKKKMGFKERMRWIWRILVTGDIWSDWIIISEIDKERLKKWL